MADDLGEKTEPPTPRRRGEARKRGQVARSQDLTAAVLMLGGLVGLLITGPGIWRVMMRSMRLGMDARQLTSVGELTNLAATMAVEVCKGVGPLMVILVVVALLILYAQVGTLFTWQPLMPSLNKINPLAGLKRMFSARTMMQLLLNVAKLAAVSLTAYVTIVGLADRVCFSSGLDIRWLFPFGADLVFTLALRLALLMLVLAVLDFAYQRYRHEKDLRMSKQEVKEELKSMEGDPVLKRRRRQVQMQLALQRIRKDVPQADVVVTNPTHYAVALKYDAEAMSAPRVVAKGADFLALRIREVAAAAGVPIVERPWVARALYQEVDVGREIPDKLFTAVAEILAYVYELSGGGLRPRPVPVG